MLRSGALPASLTYLDQREVGPTLGADSVRAGIIASLIGLGLVTVFMLVYYRLSGINAFVSIGLNLVILLAFMSYVGAVMTLPGIAGFILTIGMGVDSNVLIFERIREELDQKRGARQAVAAGFDRVFITHRRHAHLVDDCRGVPVPVRHGADSRVRHDAVLWFDFERVHGRVRLAHPVRVHPVAQARRRGQVEHLTAA